ncbi:MAG: tRNA (cytidine(56)-2'-O)-methyltransferase [Crenarchaeota archaeon]|nr:tRNA (cytidine(56)-2'-O)-methyltransferase [Thermoproteota archaeon]MCR8453484.1 tRNA (cytidine(56)-2'-O)-methyltransferase [Thermoproteota archaeon]MCR8454871.1 tRNA (cytidine(56)-2'-O)-methyltransferase [Thermoproteota archaeon]MCR8462757.1 tRNA (cytidine(56)-2'-O)-methyltransferase [Thermoproteota archaeon]MCR8471543.1 tRNA (cytidine(56)-2'-O)-methyltransferase [Thermoproteota archaeon]
MNKVYVLRLGHRVSRDKRITTHVCLVARAFGASGCFITGDFDPGVIRTIDNVCKRWGGREFECTYVESWRSFLKDLRKNEQNIIVHLTMYGLNLPQVIDDIRAAYAAGRNIIIVVGSEKVPREVYELSNFNVAIGNQPHSEVAALAVFLDWLFEGKELSLRFSDANLVVIPQARGKKVVRVS